MEYNLTEGSITGKLLKFAFPLMIGNLLQQCYNIADTLIVGRFLGADALAAVGSAYTLMVFLTSIILGLCMGSSAFFSMQYGAGNTERLKKSFFLSFVLIGAITLLLNLIVVWKLGLIIRLLQIPAEIQGLMRDYLWIIFMGLIATFLYNYFANLLRAVGNSMVPLIFLAFSAVLNIILDLVFVLIFHWGVKGSRCDRILAVCFRCGNPAVLLCEIPASACGKMPYEMGFFYFKRNYRSFCADLYAAVDHESGNPDGAGAGKQFRNSGYGSFCRGCEN